VVIDRALVGRRVSAPRGTTLARTTGVFTIAIYLWCSVAALAFFATFVVLAAEYAFSLFPTRRASHDEIEEAPRSTMVPVSAAR
jgi:hypothetical protein